MRGYLNNPYACEILVCRFTGIVRAPHACITDAHVYVVAHVKSTLVTGEIKKMLTIRILAHSCV